MTRDDDRARLGTVASGWERGVVPCLDGPGGFCLVHWRFCAAKWSPHARGPRDPEVVVAATQRACARIRDREGP